MNTIYMDNAATTYPKPESVYEAIDYFNRHMGGNPGRGSNQRSLKSGSIVVEARDALARLFNIEDSSQIAFTQNITESLNIVLKGLLKQGDHVITTSMEHNSVARPLNIMSREGIEWTQVKCEDDGSLNPEDIKKAIKNNTKLICILHASNLTGTIMPVEDIGKIARENNVLFAIDSAQTAGVLPVDVVKQNIDILTFTGHKGLLGPQGTGGLYIKPGLVINPLKVGGTGSLSESLEHPDLMPDCFESGTLNTPGIAGLLAGVEFIEKTGLVNIQKHEQIVTDMLIGGLKEIKSVNIYGPQASNKQTAVVAFNIEGMDCGELSMSLDMEFGVINRSGLHCTPLAHQTIGTYEIGACRLSPGFFTTEDEIAKVIKAVNEISKRV
ncbi:Cysteine desulfurase [Candidatus Syntrophocurvum alkaliphilum]|uniref:cysteine desulfurase n=1 Tax=Candidatus Syntrophocurvum alkaliphilum TaxID=2293317 RepID=A0A6I6DDJ1_9FIRM|nr:aminotransferase class V-fold PLP-dependent enzyme [Candidatus Syntrophocurvum alkaliphilum]QGT98651.1 Cysteine desulfurase [Candidatus Syntrophocurvum alkaliphilum]